MKRATITIPDDLEKELEDFLAKQEAPPSLTNLMQTALRSYLEQRKWHERGYRAPEGRLAIPAAQKGSGKRNIAKDHDQYLAKS
jgi:metal-responsive CopG/Arc/MetJ family transcriptional regulator